MTPSLLCLLKPSLLKELAEAECDTPLACILELGKVGPRACLQPQQPHNHYLSTMSEKAEVVSKQKENKETRSNLPVIRTLYIPAKIWVSVHDRHLGKCFQRHKILAHMDCNTPLKARCTWCASTQVAKVRVVRSPGPTHNQGPGEGEVEQGNAANDKVEEIGVQDQHVAH